MNDEIKKFRVPNLTELAKLTKLKRARNNIRFTVNKLILMRHSDESSDQRYKENTSEFRILSSELAIYGADRLFFCQQTLSLSQ